MRFVLRCCFGYVYIIVHSVVLAYCAPQSRIFIKLSGKTGLLAMLMKKMKNDPDAKKGANEDDDELEQDAYKEDKPPEKTPDPTTKPIWRPPASR